MIRVYRLPENVRTGFLFGGGVDVPFHNVDWFDEPQAERDFPDGVQVALEGFLRQKTYVEHGRRYLVLSDQPNGVCFVMNTVAPPPPLPKEQDRG